jgi:hydroxyacylglutathione hydrolase
MKFIQYYLDCLSHASYMIGDETTKRAVVVDPQRDVSGYLADAKDLGFTIDLVIETHFHADFLSGHLELAKATGAKIVYSSVAEAEFEFMGVDDGERYSLGEVTLEFRHTPGHTPESLSIVVYEHANDEVPYGWSTAAARRKSPRATCAARSTSGSTGATPSSPVRSCLPMSTSCFSPNPARSAKVRIGSAVSDSTA